MEDTQPAYERRGVPRLLNIKGYDLFYKDPPLKEGYFVYRCKKKYCKYFIKINKIKKYNNKRNNNTIIDNKNNDYIYLFNSDVYYEELIKNKKIKKKEFFNR